MGNKDKDKKAADTVEVSAVVAGAASQEVEGAAELVVDNLIPTVAGTDVLPDEDGYVDTPIAPYADYMERERPRILQLLRNSTGALHSVHVRLSEMVPFMKEATEAAEGDVKEFLRALASFL